LFHGAVAAGWGAQRREHLESRLQRYVIERSSDPLSLHWAEAMDSARRKGRPIAAADAWVAATALNFGVPLITHNKNHFIGVDGLTVISESGRS
jgi:predicted nucleic acid-binding protein